MSVLPGGGKQSPAIYSAGRRAFAGCSALAEARYARLVRSLPFFFHLPRFQAVAPSAGCSALRPESHDSARFMAGKRNGVVVATEAKMAAMHWRMIAHSDCAFW